MNLVCIISRSFIEQQQQAKSDRNNEREKGMPTYSYSRKRRISFIIKADLT